MVQVAALVLDDAGQSLDRYLKQATIKLLHHDKLITQAELERQDYNEEEGGYYVFFLHPPMQKHMYVLFEVELSDGRVAEAKNSVSLKDPAPSDAATNPVVPLRPIKDFANSWDADGKDRSPI